MRDLRRDPHAWRQEDDGLCSIFAALLGSLVAGIGSAGIGALGSVGAAGIQGQEEQQALDFQKQVWQQTQQNLSPYINAAPGSVNSLQTLLGQGPQGMQGALSALQATPGYQFQLQQGEQAITDQATATGGVGGGNTLKALLGYGQGLAGTTYQNAVGNAYNFAGLNENAAAGLGNTGVAAANNIASTYAGLGNAGAAGANGISNLLANILQGGNQQFTLGVPYGTGADTGVPADLTGLV